MSWSLERSSAPGFRGAAVRIVEESRSLVPYWENPMAYDPEKLCWCDPRRKAPRWISWSRQNPGRRYYACMDAMLGTDDAGLLPLLAPDPVLLEVDAPEEADNPASAVAVLFLRGLNLLKLVLVEGPGGTELVAVGGADALPSACCKFRINMQ
ncbi:hypothetical protein ZWY2020_033459 [Hordeum vulgare]|nr:hypothetical protein ZWY2020_033459 [Hordeum vulgare]